MVLTATALDAAVNEPVRLHNDLEASLERLSTRGRELAGTLIRPQVDVQEMEKCLDGIFFLWWYPIGTTGP